MWDTVKRIVLSASVVVLFALYAFQNQSDSEVGARSVARANPTTTRVVDDVVPTATGSSSGEVAFESEAITSEATAAPTETAQLETPTAVATVRTANALPTKTPKPGATKTPKPTKTPEPTATAKPTKTPKPTSTPEPQGQFVDGTYEGSVEDAHWGDLQVVAIVENGELVDVQFAEYPNHRNRSVRINERAMPMLTTEAIVAQDADVDIVSGATDTSEAFIRSLETALAEAAR